MAQTAMTETCKNCRHWHRPKPDWRYETVILGTCAAIILQKDIIKKAVAASENPEMDEFDEEHEEQFREVAIKAIKDAKAMTADREDYSASLISTEDFGCTLFKMKD